MALDQVLYTAYATATGGRAGKARSSDGALDVTLTTPKELHGDGAPGTNPEQLFAAGYAGCFLGAMKLVAGNMKVALPADTFIAAEVGIGPRQPKGFGIAVQLTIHAAGAERATVQQVVDAAHEICPYSNATRGNVDVVLKIA